MPDLPPEEQNPAAPRRRTLTPEQRSFLGTPRKSSEPARESPTPAPERPASSPKEATPSHPAERRSHSSPGGRVPPQPQAQARTEQSRVVELQTAIYVLGGLLALGMIFYAGLKFDAVKYHLLTRIRGSEQLERGPDKYPGLSSDELLETALAAEKRGDWKEATDRMIAAKQKDHALAGVLFRVGKGSYERGDFEGAAVALEHAIRLGENLAAANYYRGLIAAKRKDLAAAAGYFEAATKADPFVADYFYFWGEALRLDQRPREAIRRYQQALERTPGSADAELCQFKIRLARIEAAEVPQVAADVAAARAAGPLSTSWLLTDAALQLHAGRIAEARQLIDDARAASASQLFLTCVSDNVFLRAAEAHPEIAAALRPAPAPAR